MNGKGKRFLSFRRGDENRPPTSRFPSGTLNGTAPPGSLSEGAAERSEAEGVYPDERNHSKISEFICAGVQIFGPEQPSDDTPSVSPCGLPAPSEREPGWLSPFTRLLAKIQRCGRFSSPLRNSKNLTFYHSSYYTPPVSLSLDSSLREGAGTASPTMPITRPLDVVSAGG